MIKLLKEKVQEKYDSTQEENLPLDKLTIILFFLAVIFSLCFIFSLQTESQQRFCSGQGYNYVAYISPNKVCINETLAYIEIKCSGLLNLSCEVLSEKKQFKRQEDFSDYVIQEF